MSEINEMKNSPAEENSLNEHQQDTDDITGESGDVSSPDPEQADTSSPENENSAEPEENLTDADEADEDDDYNDENNLAAVAERITGVRHSIATTAAPVRVRESTGRIPVQPKATAGIPVRDQNNSEASAGAADAEKNEEPIVPAEKPSHRKLFTTVVSAALAVIVLLGAVIVTVNVTAEKERPADITIGEEPDGNAEVIEPQPEETAGSTETDSTETDEPADTDDPVNSDVPVPDETDAPVEETEPETEPEPVKFTVTVDFFDKEDVTVVTEAITFGELLAQAGCRLEESDVPSVSADTLITEDSVIKVDKRVWLTDTSTEEIPYESRKVEIDTIPRGETNYIQYGENGTKTLTYAVEYLNGVEVSRTVTGEEVTKWPVEEVYEVGVGGSFVGSDGQTYTYSLRRVVPATYYNIEGLTYLGTMADESVIAVDRTYIPLGTKLYVKNANYDFGVRIASDVGSAIKGWEIDIWIDDTNPQLESFAYTGYHWDMEIYYID